METSEKHPYQKTGQPLREAVSWNIQVHISHGIVTVSLFVRLWVEITAQKSNMTMELTSASSWGCELKYEEMRNSICHQRQPLREAVSWNDFKCKFKPRSTVSLFVRLWVEIIKLFSNTNIWFVSLFVRLWVEISNSLSSIQDTWVSLFVRLWVEIYQYELCYQLLLVSLFVRLWVEMSLNRSLQLKHLVSLFVRLWVEIPENTPSAMENNVSLFVRLWVEMLLKISDVSPLNVSLFVRLWVEMNLNGYIACRL